MLRIALATLFLFLAVAPVEAATLDVDVTDSDGRPAADAVVSLIADGAPVASHVAEKAIIDQRHEMFLPLVVVVRKGGHVIFTNNDTTKHQVYSFSAIKQFQFVISQGETSAPVEFPEAGIAAIGCNIHDQMITYAYVSDGAYAMTTDDKGHLTIPDVADGHYRVALWHPQMGPMPAPATSKLDVARDQHLALSLPIAIEPTHGMKHMHMDY
jgi:plastocyanin